MVHLIFEIGEGAALGSRCDDRVALRERVVEDAAEARVMRLAAERAPGRPFATLPIISSDFPKGRQAVYESAYVDDQGYFNIQYDGTLYVKR